MNIKKLLIAGGVLAVAIPAAITLAAISVSNQPASLVTVPTTVKASSGQIGLFSFGITQDAGETLSSVSVTVNNNASNVTGTHLASVSVYKDNGDGIFNSTTDALAGTQVGVNVGSPTVITTSSNNTIGASTTKFFVSLATSGTWTDASPADSITVTLPSNGIITSANSPTVTQATTASITADITAPTLQTVVAQNTGGTAAKEAGDTLVLTFSENTNKPSITSANIASILALNNSHSFLDGAGALGSASWNSAGNILTITLSSGTSVPSVSVGDTVTVSGSTIADMAGNLATGAPTITGSFGGLLVPNISTSIHNASNSVVTSVNNTMVVHDSASVTGSGATPTGTATFQFWNNGSCNSTSAATSSALALASGSVDATGFTQGPLAAGSYSFMASYSGDANYQSGSSACEPLTVTVPGQNGVTIATQLSSTAVQVNTPVFDNATLSGATASAGGSVTYNVYSGSLCSGTPAFTSTKTVTNGVVPASDTFTPTVVGTYNWQAVYSGDANNSSATSSCGSETVTVSTTTTPTCTNGIINGQIYKIVGHGPAQFFLASNCTLQSIANPGQVKKEHCHDMSGDFLNRVRKHEDNDGDDDDKTATSSANISAQIVPVTNTTVNATANTTSNVTVEGDHNNFFGNFFGRGKGHDKHNEQHN